MMTSKIKLLMLMMCLSATSLNAQQYKTLIRKGNGLYDKENYVEAENLYKNSLEKKYNPKAHFNLGDAQYMQGKYDEAANSFKSISQRKSDDGSQADAYYNLGNSLLSQEKYAEAMESYRNALKINPDDADAKYNYEYARQKLIVQQQQQQQQNQEENKDKNQENQEEQQQQEQQQEQNQEEDQEENQDKQQEDQQQQQNQQQQDISKEEAERILQALENQEKEVMEDQNGKKAAALPKRRIQKDW